VKNHLHQIHLQILIYKTFTRYDRRCVDIIKELYAKISVNDRIRLEFRFVCLSICEDKGCICAGKSSRLDIFLSNFCKIMQISHENGMLNVEKLGHSLLISRSGSSFCHYEQFSLSSKDKNNYKLCVQL